MNPGDWSALALSLRLAATTTLILLLVGIPLAWWLARTKSRWRAPIAAIVALPLVLPPTVLGYYLLVAMGPSGPIGRATQACGLGLLPFTFSGLVLASVVYSLPFAVQPLENAFAAVDPRLLEAAATLRAGPWNRFFRIALPLARRGIIAATVMGFAHTVGELGIVLMIGGNIPGSTRVASLQIYNHVEALEYSQANGLSGVLLAFSFCALIALSALSGLGGQGRDSRAASGPGRRPM